MAKKKERRKPKYHAIRKRAANKVKANHLEDLRYIHNRVCDLKDTIDRLIGKLDPNHFVEADQDF